METITLTFATLTRSRSFPDGSGARALAAARIRLSMPSPTFTAAQVFNAVADEIFTVLQQNVLNAEREAARVTADASVPAMPLT